MKRVATDVGTTASHRRYTGTIDCLIKAYLHNGVLGLYTGLGISMTGAVLFRSLFIGKNDSFL